MMGRINKIILIIFQIDQNVYAKHKFYEKGILMIKYSEGPFCIYAFFLFPIFWIKV